MGRAATLELEPHQVAELEAFADGPHRPAKHPSNLLRRNLVMSVGPHGATKYVLTEAGRAALDLAKAQATKTIELEVDRLHGLLRDAFLRGFLLEHDWKSASRYPLAGYSTSTMRALLGDEFEAWLKATPLLGDAEGRAIAEAPYVAEADG